MIRLVILDRDGVINRDREDGVKSLAEWEMLPKVPQAVATLNQAGLRVVVATNQSIIGRGIITEQELAEIHLHMQAEFAAAGAVIDKIYVAPDHPDYPTPWRKPGPGMLQQAMADFQILPDQTVMIGDALRDMQAAAAAGCRRILVKTGRGAITAQEPHLAGCQPLLVAEDLAHAAQQVLQHAF
jgi:D-glycero-D-manno-heptose 1,7-bisphosphate phosphatase